MLGWLMMKMFEKEGVPMLYKLILFELFTAVLINLALNYYWSFLILKQLYRMAFKNSSDSSFEGEGEKTVGNGNETPTNNAKRVEMKETKSD